jgi:CTP synthase (UTP-ammonia lyase)
MAFVEALRQLQLRVAREDFCLLHVSMVPSVGEGGEQKTKPTQHSVKGKRCVLCGSFHSGGVRLSSFASKGLRMP